MPNVATYLYIRVFTWYSVVYVLCSKLFKKKGKWYPVRQTGQSAFHFVHSDINSTSLGSRQLSELQHRGVNENA